MRDGAFINHLYNRHITSVDLPGFLVTMQIESILIFILAAFLVRYLPNQNLRRWFMLVLSVVALFWLQPSLPIRYLDFFLPIFALLFAFIGWLIITPQVERWNRINKTTIGIVVSLILLLSLTRYLSVTGVLTPSRPPAPWLAIIPILLALIGVLLTKGRLQKNTTAVVLISILIGLLFVLKTPQIAEAMSRGLRSLLGQSVSRSSALDVRWFGFSYIVFRLIHTLLDYKNKRLKNVNLQEYVLYLFFFPALSAGPIDKIQRFLEDIRGDSNPNQMGEMSNSLWRLLIGLTKKFVIADTLAILALNEKLALQIHESGWMWLFVYVYAFQIFFDFSGYTDMAISLGSIMGVHLPENFKSPYLKPSLKLFWDNWHITLTQWFRTYYFNPISRKLRKNYKNMPVWVFVLIMQLTTMLLIGLWHGVTLNFVIWGVWHGIGLFLENRWSEWLEPRIQSVPQAWMKTMLGAGSTLFVFNFVALGWVWFALPSVKLSTHVFSVLLGG